MLRTRVAAVFALLAAAGLAGCAGGGHAPAPDAASAAPKGFSVALHGMTGEFGGVIDGTSLEYTALTSGLGIEVHVAGAKDLKSVGLVLNFDAASWHPVSAEPLGLFASEPAVHLALLPAHTPKLAPGELHFGAVLAHPEGVNGMSGDGSIARVQFAPGPEPPRRDASSTPGSKDFIHDLVLLDGNHLMWNYRNTGDYNLDGLVSINDITPIGQFWQAKTGDENWQVASAADGNGDGLISINDLSAIGQNYRNFIVGYEIWATTALDAEWMQFSSVTMADLKRDASRPYFRFDLPVGGHTFYRVWPYDNSDDEGWWSNYTFDGHNPLLQLTHMESPW